MRKASPETFPASFDRTQVYFPVSAVVVLVISKSPSSKACNLPERLIISESENVIIMSNSGR